MTSSKQNQNEMDLSNGMPLSQSPATVGDPFFLQEMLDRQMNSHDKAATPISESSLKSEKFTWTEFLDQVPRAVEHRKADGISPGAPNDPICELLR